MDGPVSSPVSPPSSSADSGASPSWRLLFPWVLSLGVMIGGIYGIIYWDVVSRAKECYLKGEQYARWNEHPEEKKSYFEERYQQALAQLERDHAGGKWTDAAYTRQKEALAFDRDNAIQESSLKYAYQWYKDTYELFSPPESTWVRQAREKAPHALALWEEELRAQKIPFEDYMVQ